MKTSITEACVSMILMIFTTLTEQYYYMTTFFLFSFFHDYTYVYIYIYIYNYVFIGSLCFRSTVLNREEECDMS